MQSVATPTRIFNENRGAPLAVVYAFPLPMPFETRKALDPRATLVGLKFRYNPAVSEILKACFKRLRRSVYDADRQILAAGGWHRPQKVWWCERDCWPQVKTALEQAGVEVREALP